MVQPTTRDRIAALESQVATLTAASKSTELETDPHSSEIDIEVAIQSDESERLWHLICAVDRFTSITLHPPDDRPSRTALSDVPVIREGKVYPPAYIYQLSGILYRVQQANDFVQDGNRLTQYQEMVQNIDRDIHALADQCSTMWWQSYETLSKMERLIQFWHYYLLAFLHLQPALSADGRNIFAYSREKFYKASKDGLGRYVSLWSSATEASLVTPIEDQAFSITAFLLLASHSPRGDQELEDDLRTLSLIHRALDCFRSSTNQVKLPSARNARSALTSLTRLHEFFASQEAEQTEEAELSMVLVGCVIFRRADSQIGVGDVRCESLPWSFEIDFREPWPEEYQFRTYGQRQFRLPSPHYQQAIRRD